MYVFIYMLYGTYFCFQCCKHIYHIFFTTLTYEKFLSNHNFLSMNWYIPYLFFKLSLARVCLLEGL